jgi:hypothetical protein
MRRTPALLFMLALFAVVAAEDIIIGTAGAASSYPYCGS